MALTHSPSIVRSGLALHLDAANIKSYPGSGASWIDLSGNATNGTLVNSPTYNSANNGSFVFNGTNSYVSTTFTPSNSFSITMQFMYTGNFLDINRGLFSTFSTGNYNGIYLATAFTNSTMNFWVDGNSRYFVNYTFVSGTWYSITITSSGTSINVYVNSVLVNTVSNSTTHKDVLMIGQSRFNANYWTGNSGGVMVYNRVLSAAEVQQNYQATRDRYGI